MKLNLDIKVASRPEWLDAVLADFDAFLQDHADCERKASAMAMSFVAKYPDRTEIIPELIETAVEELEHFQSVYQIMESRGIQLTHSIGEDLYVKALLQRCHSGRKERFMDRLLIASVLETRGAERFRLVAEALEDEELARFYKMLWTSEAKHGHIFVKMALQYFDKDAVYRRLDWWLDQEAAVLEGLEIRPALH
ncbi:MAG: tRNA-(ms[2]io[6]A)-hydroxylase [Phaeodactylibacter sp.]|nr:tRNA-(ms[2]io[6]A)-hydroxylase [Phaeodactylibacter sp.]